MELIGLAFAGSFDKMACVANGERTEPLTRPELQELANMLAFGWAAVERLRRASELLNGIEPELPEAMKTMLNWAPILKAIKREFPPLPQDDEAAGK